MISCLTTAVEDKATEGESDAQNAAMFRMKEALEEATKELEHGQVIYIHIHNIYKHVYSCIYLDARIFHVALK